MMSKGRFELPGDSALIEAAENQLRRTGAGACLIRKPGEDFVIVVGPAEAVSSLIKSDIDFYAQSGLEGLGRRNDQDD